MVAPQPIYQIDQVRRRLAFLAGMLTRTRATEFLWWTLPRVLPGPLGAVVGPRWPRRLPTRMNWGYILGGLRRTLGRIIGVSACVVALYSLYLWNRTGSPDPTRQLIFVLPERAGWQIAAAVLGMLVLAAVWFAISAPSGDVYQDDSVREQLRADFRSGWFRGLYMATLTGSAICAVLFVWWPVVRNLLGHPSVKQLSPEFSATLSRWVGAGVNYQLGGIAGGSVALLVLIGWIVSTAWFRFRLTSLLLATTGRTPVRIVEFLEDSHRRGVLRLNGVAYQFRHRSVQRHLSRPGVADSTAEDVIEEARQLVLLGNAAGAQRALERMAMYEQAARDEWAKLFGRSRSRPRGLVPLVLNWKAAYAAVAWWEGAIDDEVPGAVLELSNLYEWLIEIQPAEPVGLMRSIWLALARSFWAQQSRLTDEQTRELLQQASAHYEHQRSFSDYLELLVERVSQKMDQFGEHLRTWWGRNRRADSDAEERTEPEVP